MLQSASPGQHWPMQVYFDGACPLCSREARHWKARDKHGRIEWVDIAARDFDARAHGLDPAELQKMMHARLADGRVVTQVRAFVEIWKAIPTWWNWLLRLLLKVPGMMWVAGIFYRTFARNRYRLTGRCHDGACGLPGSRSG